MGPVRDFLDSWEGLAAHAAAAGVDLAAAAGPAAVSATTAAPIIAAAAAMHGHVARQSATCGAGLVQPPLQLQGTALVVHLQLDDETAMELQEGAAGCRAGSEAANGMMASCLLRMPDGSAHHQTAEAPAGMEGVLRDAGAPGACGGAGAGAAIQLRPLSMADFDAALAKVRPSVMDQREFAAAT
jgi:hypothetical protein